MSAEDGERTTRQGEPDAAFSQGASGDGVAGEGLGEMGGCSDSRTMKRSQDRLSSSVGGISGIA